MLGIPTTAVPHARLLTIVSVMAALVAAMLLPPASEARRSARLDRQEGKIVRLINGIRANHGLNRVRVSRRLNRAANGHSWDMVVANYFSHTSRNGTPSATRVRHYRNARKVGEVLAYVPRSQKRGAAWRVVQMWMNSPGHRAVLLHGGFRRVGVARQAGNMGGGKKIVFTADFTSAR
jgi:uncharacterized protein YkwD